VTEFLKPGLEEAVTVLPAWLGGRLVAWAERKNIAHKLHFALRVRTDTIFGYGLMRALAKLKWMRRRGHRYAVEQATIERWLAAIEAGARLDDALGVAIAGLGRLIKGYSDTRVRAFANFNGIFERIVDPALAGAIAPTIAAVWIEDAHKAALADDEGLALRRALEKEPEVRRPPANTRRPQDHAAPLEVAG
jgi:indolepyruvate ferredoxin oxidoreductase beta subunit